MSRAVLEVATGQDVGGLRYFRRQAMTIDGLAVDVSRTGYTGDLGYELWVAAADAPALWDALTRAGAGFAIRPAGMLALDIVRLEAGLILLDVDYTSSRSATTPAQAYSPFEIGLGHFVDLTAGPFTGRRALLAEQREGGPARWLVGLTLDWAGIERLAAAQGLSPSVAPTVSRAAVPVFGRGGHQIGRLTSSGWSPIRKELIGLASVPRQSSAPGTRVEVEWTVEGHRGRVGATVVPLPFLDLARKRA